MVASRLAWASSYTNGEPGRDIGSEFGLRDGAGRLDESTTLTWTFADGAANDHQVRDREVDRVVARTYADRALRDAVEMNRGGAWDEARALLRAVARRIRSYAGDNPVLRGIVAELQRESEAWARERTEFDRKVRYSASEYALRSRDYQGAAQRRP